MNIEVYSDGSATSNDKPGGYGWVMVIDGHKYSEGSGHMALASNNDAELEAAISGLTAANDFLNTPCTLEQHIANQPIAVTLVSDSQLVLGWATGKYAFRQQDKLNKYNTLRLLMANLKATTRWVEGHSGQEHNERCDELANQARLGSPVEPVPLTNKYTTQIGSKKTGVVCFWYKNCLKVINLEDNIVEDYDRATHGPRGSMFEIREEKSR